MLRTWDPAVPQGDQLTGLLIREVIGMVAGSVRGEQERFTIKRRENAFGRHVIAVLAVAHDKVAATQVAERKVLDSPKIALAHE
jgi:hypothetical protein